MVRFDLQPAGTLGFRDITAHSLLIGSFFALLNLLQLTGLIYHLAVDHGLGNDFYNLPGPYVVFCNTELNQG